MFHIVIGNCEDYVANCHTLKDAIKEAQKLVELIVNDYHRPAEVHIVDTNNHIVW